MKWKYDMDILEDIVRDGGRIETDAVEAFRAGAEQLERIANTAEFGRRLTVFGLEQLLGVLVERNDPAAASLRDLLERLRASLT